MKKIIAILATIPMLAFAAGLRVDSEPTPSTANKSNGVACVSTNQIQYVHGGELREICFHTINTNIPTLTATVYRISYDLAITTTVATVTSAGTNTTTTINPAVLFRQFDYLTTAAGATGITYKVRPGFIAYE